MKPEVANQLENILSDIAIIQERLTNLSIEINKLVQPVYFIPKGTSLIHDTGLGMIQYREEDSGYEVRYKAFGGVYDPKLDDFDMKELASFTNKKPPDDQY